MGLFDFAKKKKQQLKPDDATIGLQQGDAQDVTSSTATGVLGNEDLEDIKERLKAINRMGKH